MREQSGLWLSIAATAIALAACSSSDDTDSLLPDAMIVDAAADAGVIDLGAVDASPTDAHFEDASVADAVFDDASVADAVFEDAIAADALPLDAEPSDSGIIGPGDGGYETITFDNPGVTYVLTGFGGAEDSVVTSDPTTPSNLVVRVVKSAVAELWAGTTISTQPNDSIPVLPFDVSNTRMTVRVYSPDANIVVRLKVEDATNPTVSCETEARTTVAGAWETLTFDFATQAPGTAQLNVAQRFDRVSIFFNFGVTGAASGAKTYYLDEVAFLGGGGVAGADAGVVTDAGQVGDAGSGPSPTIDFDTAGVTYQLLGFGGAEDSTVVLDPVDPANNVARVLKSATAELWAGTTVATAPNSLIDPLPFSASRTRMSVRIWSPDAGIQIRLKVEDGFDPTHSVETEATVTTAGTWETLTFNFANQAPGTAALNLGYTFNRVSVFCNFGVTGGVVGEKIYYFDDLVFLP